MELMYAVVLKGKKDNYTAVYVKGFYDDGKPIKDKRGEHTTAVCCSSVGACNTARKLARRHGLEYLGRITKWTE